MDNPTVINATETISETRYIEDNKKEEFNLIIDKTPEKTEVDIDNNKQNNVKEDGNVEITINEKKCKDLVEIISADGLKTTEHNESDKKRKPPAIWVQYNQAYPQGQGYGQGYGYGQGNPQGPQHNYGGGQHYGGAPLEYNPESRNIFVKFVFSILFVMLLITAAIAIFILATPSLKEFYQEKGLLLMIASMIVMVAMNYVMACSQCSRVPPCNFISLVIIVLAMSNLVGAVTVRYKTHILVCALIATVVTVAVCILLACSRFDFTKWYIYIIVIAVAFSAICMVISIAMLVMDIRYKPLQIVMLFVGGLINVVILIMELQMILGGKAIEMGEDDYALAAYLLYTSIIDIFLKIVQMLGLMDGD